MLLPQFELNAQIEEDHWWFCARREIVDKLVRRLLPPGDDAQIIDIGCGTGANIAALAHDYRAMGVDPSEDAIAFARKRFPHVDFRCGRAPEVLAGTDGARRLFLLMDVLEHVPEDRRFFADIVDPLREGDLLLITVPADMALWSPHDESHGHYLRYDEQRLREVWSGLPFEELLFSYFNARLYPLIRLIREITRRKGRSFGDADTDLKMPSPVVNRFLRRLMAGEAAPLLKRLDEPQKRTYARGVSLLAVLRCTREGVG